MAHCLPFALKRNLFPLWMVSYGKIRGLVKWNYSSCTSNREKNVTIWAKKTQTICSQTQKSSAKILQVLIRCPTHCFPCRMLKKVVSVLEGPSTLLFSHQMDHRTILLFTGKQKSYVGCSVSAFFLLAHSWGIILWRKRKLYGSGIVQGFLPGRK